MDSIWIKIDQRAEPYSVFSSQLRYWTNIHSTEVTELIFDNIGEVPGYNGTGELYSIDFSNPVNGEQYSFYYQLAMLPFPVPWTIADRYERYTGGPTWQTGQQSYTIWVIEASIAEIFTGIEPPTPSLGPSISIDLGVHELEQVVTYSDGTVEQHSTQWDLGSAEYADYYWVNAGPAGVVLSVHAAGSHPTGSLPLYEGGPAGSVTLKLSAPVTFDIDIRVLPNSGDEGELTILAPTFRIARGTTEISIPVAQALRDGIDFERNQETFLYFNAIVDGKASSVNFTNGTSTYGLKVVIEDEYRRLILNPDDETKKMAELVREATSSLMEALRHGLAGRIDEIEFGRQMDKANAVLKKIGLVLDLTAIHVELRHDLAAANSAANPDAARAAAYFKAAETYLHKIPEVAFLTGVSALAVWTLSLPALAGVAGTVAAGLAVLATGVAAKIVYDDFLQPIVQKAVEEMLGAKTPVFFRSLSMAESVEGPNTFVTTLSNDGYRVDHADDKIVELPDTGYDAVFASADFVLPAHVESLVLEGTARSGSGNAMANELHGNAEDNELGGQGGDDEIFGEVGDDFLTGGEGADLINGGDGSDQLSGGEGADVLAGENGSDALDGGAGQDTASYVLATAPVYIDLARGTSTGGEADGDTFTSIENVSGSSHDDILTGDDGQNVLSGYRGADTLIGGPGNDSLDGGANPEGASGQGDVMLGGEGDDTYHVDSGLDLVDEGGYFPGYGFGGFDTIISTTDFYWDIASVGERLVVSEDAVDAGGDGVTIVGSVFDNELIGHSGTDVMFGRGGSDIYRPGRGIDFISFSTLGVPDAAGYVANGVNTLVMDRGNSYDIVFEFEAGRDKVDLTDFDMFSTADLFDRGVDDGMGNSFFVLGDGFDYLYIVGLELSELSAGDFMV